MSITWKEGVTTLAAVTAVGLERAYFHNYSWPLVSSTRWVIAGLAALFLIEYVFSYVLDAVKNDGWTATAFLLGIATLVTGALGMIFAVSDYVVLMMLATVIFWLAALVSHAVEHPATYKHHPAY